MLFHTSVLRHPTARALHAAWQELNGLNLGILPAVAEQLAPISAGAIRTGADLAGRLLDYHGGRSATPATRRLAEESWWWTVWNDPASPYTAIRLLPSEDDRAVRLLDEIDPRCFPDRRPDEVSRSPEARIVCETIAIDAWLVLTADMQTVDHIEVNRWAAETGHRNTSIANRVLYDADASIVEWTYEAEDSERWTQAALLACWPDDDDAPAADVLRDTRSRIRTMTLDGGLPHAGGRLRNCLDTHPDPIGLVEETRRRLPSPTVNAERRHPGRHAGPPAPPRPPTPRKPRSSATREPETAGDGNTDEH